MPVALDNALMILYINCVSGDNAAAGNNDVLDSNSPQSSSSTSRDIIFRPSSSKPSSELKLV